MLLTMVEWIRANEVRLFFDNGCVLETTLPVRSARKARVVDCGMGLDPGDGKDLSARWLHARGGKILRREVLSKLDGLYV
jgi:hypothetical protein